MDAANSSVSTVADLAVYLRIPRTTVYNLAQEGEVPGQMVGLHWRFRKGTIERWLDAAHRHAPCMLSRHG